MTTRREFLQTTAGAPQTDLRPGLARLLKGDSAHQHIIDLIVRAAGDNMLTFSAASAAGAEENIFAIDGNLGGTAAITEMLLQSHAEEIEFFPALPSNWPEGEIRRLRARGRCTVDIHWHRGKLVSARILARRMELSPSAIGSFFVPSICARAKLLTWHSRSFRPFFAFLGVT